MTCSHTNQIEPDVIPRTRGCEECERTGSRWLALRMCLTCGHVGCCDSSPGKHATAHFHATEHPVMRALGGKDFAWCYVDEMYLDLDVVQLAEEGVGPVGA